ncbi:MAG: RtcB family protein [Rubrobacteraceae bacterium]
MLTGRELMALGWPEGRAIGAALRAAEEMRASGEDESSILRELEAVRENPDGEISSALEPLAREFKRMREPEPDELVEGRPYAAWGEEMIEEVAAEQMRNAMRLPVTVAGALMPDAHLGYGLPVGGVLATKGAVIPWAVGVDIACRMRLSIFDMSPSILDERPEVMKEIIIRNTNFGAGGKFKPGRRGADHEVLEDGAWGATPFLKKMKATADAQLGTSGSGNHFVEWGIFEAAKDGTMDDLEAGKRYLALLSHSGSRGVGARIADRYSKAAKHAHPRLDASVADLAWLDMDSEAGEEYWLSMELAGRFASANHAVIHAKISAALGEESVSVVENHHNYAWREEIGGEEAIVHRKGATPAGVGVLGMIPASMGDAGYVVRGKGSAESINSASHGAGRTMSRTRAFATLDEAAWRSYLEERGVILVGGGLDEAPMAYKPIAEVMARQRDLVDVLGSFTPRIVRMDGGKPRRKKPTKKGTEKRGE